MCQTKFKHCQHQLETALMCSQFGPLLHNYFSFHVISKWTLSNGFPHTILHFSLFLHRSRHYFDIFFCSYE